MKRILYVFMAAALLAGCSKAERETPETAATVHFNVGTALAFEGEDLKSGTGDGSAATQLLVGVFDASGAAIDGYSGLYYKAGDSFSFDLALVKGMTYKVVLFAQSPDRFVNTASWTASDLKAVRLGFSALNAEADDAFAAVKEITLDAPGAVNVTLSRIFAQVNVASTADAGSSAVSLKLSGLPDSYNALDGSFAGSADASFSADAPLGGTSPFAGYDYYIGYAYAPAPASGSSTATLTIGAGSRTVENLPLRTNYRTNILGTL